MVRGTVEMKINFYALIIMIVVAFTVNMPVQSKTFAPVMNYLLDDENVGGDSIVIHPDAGKHLSKPLGSTDDPFGYYIYFPQNYSVDKRTKFPLILFLHGQGEKGNGSTELGKVLRNGPPKMVRKGQHFPAIVLSPQLVGGTGAWNHNNNPELLHTLVNRIKNRYNVDTDRIYVTGLSLGGGGAWNYARLYADEVAAVVPIASIGIALKNSQDMQNIGVWSFHALKDGVVCSRSTVVATNSIAGTPPEPAPSGPGKCRRPNDPNKPINSKSALFGYPENGKDYVVSRVNEEWVWKEGAFNATGKLRMTLYPDSSHNSWSRAYNDNGKPNNPMWKWLFLQKRQPK